MGRSDLGIPDWYTVEDWLDTTKIPTHPGTEKIPEYSVKNKEIPILESYRNIPEENFWENFPVRDLPKTPSTRVNIGNLAKLVREHEHKFTDSERKRAHKVLLDLKQGRKVIRCQTFRL